MGVVGEPMTYPLNPSLSRSSRLLVLGFGVYLEGYGDLVNELIMGIIAVILWLTGVINLLVKCP